MKATAKELRFNSKELLESVARGEDVVITFRGAPCAKLVPLNREKKLQGKTELFGIWANNDSATNVNQYVRNLRKGRL